MIRTLFLAPLFAACFAILLSAGTIMLIPQAAGAQSYGLVVCGGSNHIGTNTQDSTGCQACHLFALIDRVIRFLIFLAVPIATLLFAYAGVLYFTQGAHGHQEAKAIFTDALFGFVFVLCGFLIVDTIIKTLVKGSFTGPSWQTVECVPGSARNIDKGGLGFTDVPEGTGNGLVNNSSAPVNPTVATGQCTPSALESSWGSNASRMSCVIQGESGCQEIPSGIDKGADGNPVSFGRYQINISANKMQCPGQAALNCPSAFTTPYTGANKSTQVKSDEASRVLYEQCKQAAYNPDCSTNTAQQILSEGGWGRWGADAARGCGQLQYGNM
jgi:hypothetical protein